jgi:hypothetical protein
MLRLTTCRVTLSTSKLVPWATLTTSSGSVTEHDASIVVDRRDMVIRTLKSS